MTTEIVDEFTRRSRRLPRWLLGTVGVACLLLGVAIIFKPFSSLTVLILAIIAGLVAAGIAELAGASDEPSPAMARIAGAVWLVAAVVIVVWPGATMGVLALVVGVALVVEGVLRVVGGLRGTADQRATAVISGWQGSSSVAGAGVARCHAVRRRRGVRGAADLVRRVLSVGRDP
jgi:uncharacterized membrane protein HdeD (DUF308 family)